MLIDMYLLLKEYAFFASAFRTLQSFIPPHGAGFMKAKKDVRFSR